MNDRDHPLLGPLVALAGDLPMACARFRLERHRVAEVRSFQSASVPSAIMVLILRELGPGAAALARDRYLEAYADRSKRQQPPRPKPEG